MVRRPLEFIAILYIVVWTISPPLQIGMLYRLASLGCAGILFVINGFEITKQHGYALLFIVLIAVSEVIATGSFSSTLSLISIYLLFIGYVMNYWYEYDWRDFRIIIPIILLLLALWNINTVKVIATNANAARDIVRNNELANGYLRRGVGGYGLMYAQVIIAPAIVSWIINVLKRNKIEFVCGCMWAISFVQYLNVAGYTIAVTATAIGVVMLLAYRQRSIVPALVISGLLLLLLVYLIGYNESVRNFLLSVFDGTKVARKILDISSTVTTDETAGSIYSRISVYQAGLKQMMNYPFIGSWWKKGASGHSALMDAFTLYGVYGGVIMFRMIYCVPRLWKNKTQSSIVLRTINATIITITFVALLDTVPYNLVMMLMVVFPIILSDLEEWSADDEDIMDSQFNTD